MSDTVIHCDNISKRYRIGVRERYGSLRESLMRGLKRPAQWLKSPGNGAESDTNSLWALKDVSFEVKRGEVLGIIGRNGAGKSTLLKVLSRITTPTSGTIDLEGRVGSLLEVGTGFHPELTGRENIFLNGAILGMPRADIARKFDQIVDFAEVERFLDTPVKRYSSGMYMRLAFAVAAHLEPDILVVDEVLAVGDAQFQKKCLGKMSDVAKIGGRTVLFVSHNMGAVTQLCSRALLLNRGVVEKDGTASEVMAHYLSHGAQSGVQLKEVADPSKRIWIRSIIATSLSGQQAVQFVHNQPITLSITIGIRDWVPNAELTLHAIDGRGRRVFTSIVAIGGAHRARGEVVATATIPASVLVPGNYSFSFALFIHGVWLDRQDDVIALEIVDGGSRFSQYEGMDYGCVFVDCNWRVEESAAESTVGSR